MAPLVVGVVKETAPGERRVALPPDAVARVAALGLTTVMERGAGAHAWWPDSAYRAAACIVERREVCASDVVLCVDGASESLAASLRHGQVLLGLLRSWAHPALVRQWRDSGVTAVDLARVPGLRPRRSRWTRARRRVPSPATRQPSWPPTRTVGSSRR